MKLTVSLAKKLFSLTMGGFLPRSQVRQTLVDRMLDEGVLSLRTRGTRQSIYCQDPDALHSFLKNHLGINDLPLFIETASREDLLRSEAVHVASDSKLKAIRSFKGFLVNCDQPLDTRLNAVPFLISPVPGAFIYIYDFERFVPAVDITIVGVENGENFRYLERQQGIFPFEKRLFVSRYPQSGDLIQWLRSIPNRYVHFGDFDFAGINIYMHEFKRFLDDRAEFFVPHGIEALFRNYGNRNLYDRQLRSMPERMKLKEPGLEKVWDLICREKKGVEQEVLLRPGLA
jgi:hypothetical protein